MKKFFTFAFLYIQEFFLELLIRNRAVHKVLFISGFEPYRWHVGRLKAWQAFDVAARRVPAYQAFLKKHRKTGELDTTRPLMDAFQDIPPMDKDSYIKKWSIPERSLDGKLPEYGVVVDESSGSSGTPTSWVRGPYERRAVRSLLQIGFQATAKHADKPIFILNAFSLGAWATGMNVSSSLTDITTIKSIGPDRDKIIQTMKEFGDGYTYVILSYPPFLKSLADDTRIDWQKYSVIAGFGGEGMSENMRDYLLGTFQGVYGSYGASDLEINLAIETDFTIALRRAIYDNKELADEISKYGAYGVLPMIFQYNPFDYVIETNDLGEMLVTIARRQNINPRIRYNIHDRGHIIRLKELLPVLERHGLGEIVKHQRTDLPVLFHYGRSDLSVDYNGAVVAPDTVRDIIYADPALLEITENHRLISFEDESSNKQLHIALQLRDGADLKPAEAKQLQKQIFTALLQLNKDFFNACKTSDAALWPSIAFYGYRKGPFASDGRKLKNEYVWHLAAGEVEDAKMKLSYTLPPELITEN